MANYTITGYLDTATSLVDKIKAIDALIDAMDDAALENIGNSGTISYRLDDGQMNINTEFRSVEDVQKGIFMLEQRKQRYINRLCGRTVVFRGRSKF